MKVKGIDECDFVNYKKPSMFIAFPSCTFKCGRADCQNSPLALSEDIDISKESICEKYISNPITEAFVFGGLEPFDSFIDLISLVDCIRNKYRLEDDIVIYTGYTEMELKTGEISKDTEVAAHNFNYLITNYNNIIIKFGRFLPNQGSHFDKVLGVKLASDNQYALKFGKKE